MFNPPLRKQLCKRTEDLQQIFHQMADTYIPPDYASLCQGIRQLDKEYPREAGNKTWVSSSISSLSVFTNREGQIQSLQQLLGILPFVAETQPERSNPNKMIVLGALFYRYLRITSHSILRNLLENLLHIRDRNQLDAVSILSCCTAYRAFLLEDKRYELITYIKNDRDFFTNLDAIICKAKKDARDLEEQLQYIVFIQSLPPFLDRFESELHRFFGKTEDAKRESKVAAEVALEAKAEPENFLLNLGKSSQTQILTVDRIKKGLTEANIAPYVLAFLENCCFEEQLKVSLDSQRGVGDQGDTLPQAEFQELLRDKIALYYQYALLGAYIFVLEMVSPEKVRSKSPLYRTLQHAIGITHENSLDSKCKHLALTSLSRLIDVATAPLASTLQVSAWKGLELFKKELLQTTAKIAQAPLENLGSGSSVLRMGMGS